MSSLNDMKSLKRRGGRDVRVNVDIDSKNQFLLLISVFLDGSVLHLS